MQFGHVCSFAPGCACAPATFVLREMRELCQLPSVSLGGCKLHGIKQGDVFIYEDFSLRAFHRYHRIQGALKSIDSRTFCSFALQSIWLRLLKTDVLGKIPGMKGISARAHAWIAGGFEKEVVSRFSIGAASGT